MNDKILEQNGDVNQKIEILDKLIGNYRQAGKLKEKFLKMYLLSKNDGRLVQGRGKGRYSVLDRDPSPNGLNSPLIDGVSQRGGSILSHNSNQLEMDMYKGLTGQSAAAKMNPKAAIKRIIKWEKPFLNNATKPDKIYV